MVGLVVKEVESRSLETGNRASLEHVLCATGYDPCRNSRGETIDASISDLEDLEL